MSTREFKLGQAVFYHSTSRWRAKGRTSSLQVSGSPTVAFDT
jgi:hypothetical protein